MVYLLKVRSRHQIPLTEVRTNPEHLAQLEGWLRAIDQTNSSTKTDLRWMMSGFPVRRPADERQPVTNGGVNPTDLEIPDFHGFGVEVAGQGPKSTRRPRCSDTLAGDRKANPSSFRLFGPDETASNRLQAVFEATDRTWDAEIRPGDDHLAPDGRVMEVLSEHQCQGWLEGYLLTVDTGCSTAMRPLSTSSTRCSISTPNG